MPHRDQVPAALPPQARSPSPDLGSIPGRTHYRPPTARPGTPDPRPESDMIPDPPSLDAPNLPSRVKGIRFSPPPNGKDSDNPPRSCPCPSQLILARSLVLNRCRWVQRQEPYLYSGFLLFLKSDTRASRIDPHGSFSAHCAPDPDERLTAPPDRPFSRIHGTPWNFNKNRINLLGIRRFPRARSW
jgi:hypothetical protein